MNHIPVSGLQLSLPQPDLISTQACPPFSDGPGHFSFTYNLSGRTFVCLPQCRLKALEGNAINGSKFLNTLRERNS